MTYLASSAHALWNQVQTWTSRANQAWGPTRVWNSGTSFEQMASDNQNTATTWQGRANNAWGGSRQWNVGQSFETDRNAAYDSGGWGSGNLWSTDAHNDPNVWTNRYNAGYSQATSDLQPPGSPLRTVVTINAQGVGSSGNLSWGLSSDNLGAYSSTTTLTLSKPGHYVPYAYNMGTNQTQPGGVTIFISVNGDNGVSCHADVFQAAAVLGCGREYDLGSGSVTVTMNYAGYGGCYLNAGGALVVMFVPTAAHPH